MWKRLNNPKGARQPVPEPLSYNEKDGFAPPGLGIGINRAKSPPDKSRAPPRPPREDDMSPRGLPPLPFEAIPPPPPPHRDSTFRPASSIYSQPSPNPISSQFSRSAYKTPLSGNTEEVSQPSSPDMSRQRNQHQDDHGVSPIDEMPDISRLDVRPPSRPGSSSKPPSSNIPTLRREKRRNQVATAAANLVSRKDVGEKKGRQTADVRWDPYSGEQTTSEKGKPQSVKPGQFTPPSLKSTGILGNSSNANVKPKNQTSFGDRVRRLKPNNNAPVEKPEWRGASGRATVVSPVQDQEDTPALAIPRKSSKRVTSPTDSRSSTPVSAIRSGGGETNPASAPSSERSDPTIRPVQSRPGRIGPNAHSPELPGAFPSDSSTQGRTQARGNTLPTELPTTRIQKDESTGTIERNFREALKDISSPASNLLDPYDQPPSRFSVSTYAATEATGSPRPSTDSRPPLPTPPQNFTTNQQPSPILNRKRPKQLDSSKNTMRKAVGAAPSSPVFISMTSSIASKRSTNVSKTLPQSPAEAQSNDLISSLEAQIDNLAHRRNNISRSIRQMTELMPTDGLVAGDDVRRKREDEKWKVERLRGEEADIKRQEHELGLRLHRAWKRRDKEAVYEPTGLWVRRVTG